MDKERSYINVCVVSSALLILSEVVNLGERPGSGSQTKSSQL